MTASAGTSLSAVKVTDRIYWVGAIDWGIRDFHGYATTRGTTYNAYLVLGEKIALVDTVKAPFVGELLARIRSVVDPSRIDYVISNHAEMDHSGGLPEVLSTVHPEKLFASSNGAKTLTDHHLVRGEVTTVKDLETLELGGLTLQFVEARMLHWPDSMMTYVAQEQTLLSNDAFGMHLASSQRFTDEIEPAVAEYEAAKYYANILLPLSPLVGKLLTRVTELGVLIKVIAPSHGPIWRTNQQQLVQWYSQWAAGITTRKAVIAYDTMWQSTATMAQAIGDALASAGVEVHVMPLASCHRSDVVTELLEAGALLIGSPTLNNNIFPTVADLLTYLRGLKPKNLVAAAFGSYGWSGEAVGQIEEAFQAMKLDLTPGVKAQWVPDDATLAVCRTLGETIAGRLPQ